MKEQLISFKTAKLAKENGFDLEVLYYYTKEKTLEVSRLENCIESGVVELGDLLQNFSNCKVDNFLSAPTQSLLQKWLRENYDIIVTVYANASGYCWETNKTPKNGGGTHIMDYNFGRPNDSGFWDTWEEALEVGLVEALKTGKK